MGIISEHPLSIDGPQSSSTLDTAVKGLRDDKIILWRGLSSGGADRVILGVAQRFELGEKLELQAGYASVFGHRTNSGRYFMSVNRRAGFQFVTPHSEGGSFSSIQMAALYCYKNTTDGGVSVLLQPDQDSAIWGTLRELKTKVELVGKTLSAPEIASARGIYKVSLPTDLLSDSDVVVSQRPSKLPGMKVFDVLSPVVNCESKILSHDYKVYWDSVASTDFQCQSEYVGLLKELGLYRGQEFDLSDEQMDLNHPRRLWRSKIVFAAFFKRLVIHKLAPGELMIFNNITWTHSTSNWNPETGDRDVIAAFA